MSGFCPPGDGARGHDGAWPSIRKTWRDALRRVRSSGRLALILASIGIHAAAALLMAFCVPCAAKSTERGVVATLSAYVSKFEDDRLQVQNPGIGASAIVYIKRKAAAAVLEAWGCAELEEGLIPEPAWRRRVA